MVLLLVPLPLNYSHRLFKWQNKSAVQQKGAGEASRVCIYWWFISERNAVDNIFRGRGNETITERSGSTGTRNKKIKMQNTVFLCANVKLVQGFHLWLILKVISRLRSWKSRFVAHANVGLATQTAIQVLGLKSKVATAIKDQLEGADF